MAAHRDPEPFESELSTDKVYCANCRNCKLVRVPLGGGGQYGLRVRCAQGRWRKKLGDEKIYKYFTVIRRTLESCEGYEPMGDEATFLRELRRSLPIKDELYTP